ncbi:MAG: dienelactone hydrolase family protein [Burkholderiaceae bacterium]|jgi:carboxymethylenebutenolidase|nr:dienelactone hydrolase family protein [Rhodoferax sp.]MBP6088690.1 dienelactone hydrolase family protein [Polaromonas sp.]MBP6142149.1 dienelactone hydrolase family protein [Polaromonas sp.]MBP6155471.1 dienelactone hydrolase family protein [Polaromonas sp.]MBP7116448.1 dienelactone hydrolase family protein [Polaromonas sp.]
MSTKPRLTAADFDQELLILFDAYVHGNISRRGFLDGAAKFATAGMSASMILAALSPNFAAAQVVAKDDKRISTQILEVASPKGSGSIKGLLARPANAGSKKLPAILVIHENRGLNPHIEDITRRLAVDGYMAFAPDALTGLGGYPASNPQPEDKARELFATLNQANIFEDFLASATMLQTRADSTGKLGAVGFCYGGGIVQRLAISQPGLNASVPFYGNLPAPTEAAKVKAPLLIHFAGVDERINAAWPTYEAALKAANASFTAHTYAGTQHGFNNDTTPRFDAEAAKLAWGRTMAFFAKNLNMPQTDS